MEEFIVLGQVPGTSIQIDFFMWLKLASIFVGICLLYAVRKRATRRNGMQSISTATQQPSNVFVSQPFDTNIHSAI